MQQGERNRVSEPSRLIPGRRQFACGWPRAWLVALALCLPWTSAAVAAAQAADASALPVVRGAVAAELRASRDDRTPWGYRDHDVQPGKDAVYQVLETPRGDLRRMLELNGKPLQGVEKDAELKRMQGFVNSPEEQAHARKAADADSKQASEFLSMLPEAFLWTVLNDTAQGVLLQFRPNPGFSPPDSQSKVLSVMAGQMLVSHDGNRIASLRGTLTDDVKFGFGLFGKIDKGGTFNVERRQLAPGRWQITETHVHIGGRALLFKTIGQQEDEVKTEWHVSTAPDLRSALQQLQ